MAKKSKQRPAGAATAVTPPYKPGADELRAVASIQERGKGRRTPRLRVRINGDNQAAVETDHPDMAYGLALVYDAFATGDLDFGQGVLGDLIQLSSTANIPMNDGRLNQAASIVKAIKPRDEVETLLGVQMAAIHMATVAQARKLAHSETIIQQDSNERALNKLARTFATQVEALKRYRSKGEQRVYVERVNVNEGGQAVIGNIERGEG